MILECNVSSRLKDAMVTEVATTYGDSISDNEIDSSECALLQGGEITFLGFQVVDVHHDVFLCLIDLLSLNYVAAAVSFFAQFTRSLAPTAPPKRQKEWMGI
jgi:hypothetical protein